MKGIVLAGGLGTRLLPTTKVVNKHLLLLYDKPIIYYSISTLMLSGIREICLITKPEDVRTFRKLLGNGSDFGIEITYRVQVKPKGIGEAFLLTKSFIKNSNCALILGDNIFFGVGLGNQLSEKKEIIGAQIFGYRVKDARNYGVLEVDMNGTPISIEEKPNKPKSNIAVTGLYFYDSTVSDIASQIKPSYRGELEITDINRIYLQNKKLEFNLLPRGTTWLDAGTPDAIHEASSLIKTLQQRQGMKIACLEEIAWRKGWISDRKLKELISIRDSEYLLNLSLSKEL